MNQANVNLKRELKEDHTLGLFSSSVPKRARREAATQAQERLSTNLGPGGYLDNKTSDTQFFEFSQSSGLPGADYDEESQPHYGPEDDDLYFYQSQLPSDNNWPQDDLDSNKLSLHNDATSSTRSTQSGGSSPAQDNAPVLTSTLVKHECLETADTSSAEATNRNDPLGTEEPSLSSLPTGTCSWGPDTQNQHKLNKALAAKYEGQNLIYRLLEKRKDCEDIRKCWALLRNDEDNDDHP
ncbi:hypothetical protein K435DRAFT_812757 [Dendrothele bispora CBS 962.96]|uniref:Uncharacterized protein n=1 Tax=Dendrothele bispora (strain CBS 962.96) TaxID=1314807 RepID=A0A4S8KNB0_DENBC|nr:hypothetical protein K435DRAFT_812757 [Dendrothele bispora CBS 962.96]